MFNNAKKIVALAMSAFMLSGLLAGCNGDDSGEKIGTLGEDGKYTTPITISQAIKADASQKFGEGQSYDKNVWTDLIEEKLGVKLTVDWSADGATEAYLTKMNMSISSKDMPDIFNTFPDGLMQAIQAGVVADLTDAIDKYASPRLKKLLEENAEVIEACKVDGKMYGIPLIDDTNLTAGQIWIRQDWLKKVGMEAPKTWDDVVAIATAFAKNDPDGNGKDDTYGIGLQNGLWWGGVGTLDGFTSAFHGFGGETWITKDDGRIEFGGVQPEMKNALKAANDMFKEGLIDPEFTVKNLDKVIEDIYNNKVGMFFGENYVGYWPLQTMVEQNAEAYFLPYEYVSSDAEPALIGTRWPVSQYFSASNTCKNPEVVVLIANLYLEMVNDDSTQETIDKYEYSGDISSYMLCPVRITAPGFETRCYQALVAADNGDDSKLTNKMMANSDSVKAYEAGDKTMYGYWSQLGPQGSVGVIQKYIDQDRLVLTSMHGSVPEAHTGIDSELKKMQMERYVKIITGDLPIDDFDKFVTDYYAAGGEKLTEAVNEAYGK